MRLKEFEYDVFVMVEISGHELQFLQQRAKKHYDFTCKSSAEVGGFLYGFWNQWMFGSKLENLEKLDLDRTEVVRMTGHQIGILGKICEFPMEANQLLTTLSFNALLTQRLAEFHRIVTNANIPA